MTPTSYAQKFDDVVLLDALRGVDRCVYVDVGSADPYEGSMTQSLFAHGWHGTNVGFTTEDTERFSVSRPNDITLTRRAEQMDSSVTTGPAAVMRSDHLWGLCERYVPAGEEIHILGINSEDLTCSALPAHDWFRIRPWILGVRISAAKGGRRNMNTPDLLSKARDTNSHK